MSLTDLFAVNADAELFKYCAETQELVTLKLRALKHATQDHNEFAVRRTSRQSRQVWVVGALPPFDPRSLLAVGASGSF